MSEQDNTNDSNVPGQLERNSEKMNFLWFFIINIDLFFQENH
jgi:hypothetical protein